MADDDGYARVQLLHATTADPVRALVLDCVDAAGHTSTQLVDLTAGATFAPHPPRLSALRGVDRPALAGDPMRLSSAELVRRNYGLRPDPVTSPQAYAHWLEAARKPGRSLRTTARPQRLQHSVTVVPVIAGWTGAVLGGAPSYVAVEGLFNVPTAVPGGDETTITGMSVWNGVGGSGTLSGLIQSGVDIQTTSTAATYAMAAADGRFYQVHGDGTVWRYDGRPCIGSACAGWTMLDDNPATTAIAASDAQLAQLHRDGSVYHWVGTPCVGASCPGWQALDHNPATRALVAGGKDLYQLHAGGAVYRYVGTPFAGTACPGWEMVDDNPATVAIAAAGKELVQLHADGAVYRYLGQPCNGSSCPSWQLLDRNPDTVQVTASGTHLYQRHRDGTVWRYVGPACGAPGCPGWALMDSNAATREIAAGGFGH